MLPVFPETGRGGGRRETENLMEKPLRVSRYELIYPFQKDHTHAVAVNGLYGAFDVMTSGEAEILRRGKEDPEVLGALASETLDRLGKRGHLVRETAEEEEENVRILSRLYWLIPYRSHTELVILPTYNCNFRCEYCFERARLERGQQWLSRTMSEETLDAIFRQMEAYRQMGIHPKGCTLYGGEPLLNANREIVTRIIERAEALDMKLVCVTNGYELDRFIGLLKDHPFLFLQVTVDGVGETHDGRRFLAGGQGTYERIMDNIGLALENGISIHVRVNVNRSNLDSAMALPEAFRQRGFTAYPIFRYYFKATTSCFEEDPKNAITEEELFRVLCEHGICGEKDVSHSRIYQEMAARISKAMKRESYPAFSPAYCGAESTMLVVDPEGMIYPCWDLVSMEEYAIGFTDIGAGRFRFSFDFSKWRTRTVDNIPECRECPYLMYCGGGCAVESLLGRGDLRKGSCGGTPRAFDYTVVRISERTFAKDGALSQTLSLYSFFRGLTAGERQTLLTTMDQETVMNMMKDRLTESTAFFG